MKRVKKEKKLNKLRILYLTVSSIYLLLLFTPLSFIYAQETDTQAVTSDTNTEVTTTVPVNSSNNSNSESQNNNSKTIENDKQKYTLNPETGKWENDKYSWDPQNKKTSPKIPVEYSFNPESNHWDTKNWVYSPEQSNYIENRPLIDQLQQSNTSTLNEQSDITVAQTQNIVPADIKLNNSYFNNYLNINISTTHSSYAKSGDASILQNTLAGDAVSGNAFSMVNVMNLIQSVWGWQGIMPEIYTANIQGDYFGDILINPNLIADAKNNCNCNSLTVQNVDNKTLNNKINLVAESGNATVANNTNAGNATTGNATAIANVINMINSSMTSGKSFVGSINIHGNLEGDVLLPDNFFDQLIASNIPKTNIQIDKSDINLSEITNISNKIDTNVSSGNAEVIRNTNAGNSKSGDASSNITVFNLTNRNIVGENAFLVFVNVSGKWLGFITDAPKGATAAMLGGGIKESFCSNCANQNNIDSNTSTNINNIINLTAKSGDASVNNNTNAGNAVTGDAKALVNVANISSSNFAMSGWLGILFINVLNDWLGSFGTNTPYGNKVVLIEDIGTNQGNINTNIITTIHGSNNPDRSNYDLTVEQPVSYEISTKNNSEGKIVLASAKIKGPPTSSNPKTTSSNKNTNLKERLTIGIILLSTVLTLSGIYYGDNFNILKRNFSRV